MTGTNSKLTAAVEVYFADLRRIHATGAATGERSSYGPLANLLNAIGGMLNPKVYCVGELADLGAGHPDFGLFTANQVRKGRPRTGQVPERGVVEVKALDGDATETAVGEQVARYWSRYQQVLVTDTREFVLVGEDDTGKQMILECFQLAGSVEEFDHRLETPRSFARQVSMGLGEYLSRALSHRTTLAEPKDLAWLLASYARDGLSRVEAVNESQSLESLRLALEAALGVRFEGEKGVRFFHSTLVQTLFYGIFSAWVLWARQTPPPDGRFNWRESVWHLRAPIMQALFQQLSQPDRLQPLGLVEVLDWTSVALNRVNRTAFFARFNEGEAVTYFYEPFLQAFDPDLRKQLGVWYTPIEVVRYMVQRVDRALQDDLGIVEGLAADNVYVLDPCCGTGAFLAEVLRQIANNLKNRGLGALTGSRVKHAALERVFGFEIMPAPFVVSHLQIGLTMQALDARLADDSIERAQVYLTNALTGWEPQTTNLLPFPELEEERDRAERVKQETPVLVILGNPPYNAFAGVTIDEERELFEAYRKTRKVKLKKSKGLIDLYVRFFRMAERRIAEKTGQGVVCFISNYSWLDGMSFAGMRERFLDVFDSIRIDCLNGDKYKTGKVTPDGSPDPSIFSTPSDPVGIQVGTAITTLVRKVNHTPAKEIGFRNLWGRTKREELMATATSDPDALYDHIKPPLPLGLPFVRTAVSKNWFDWPTLTELYPVSFPGAKTNRDSFLVDIDRSRLEVRISDYYDENLSHEVIAQRYPVIMRTATNYDARSTRETLLTLGGPSESGFIRFAYRPFDVRWLYWEANTKLLNDKRADYKRHLFEGNLWLCAAQHLRKDATEPQTVVTQHFGAMHLIERTAVWFPIYLNYNVPRVGPYRTKRYPNLSEASQRYLQRIGAEPEDLFHHILAVLHSPDYREANAGALAMEWPRIPLPGWSTGNIESAAEMLAESANRGCELARLLNPDAPVPGITHGAIRPEITSVAVPATSHGRNMSNDDFIVTAGWGHWGTGEAVMPGHGHVVKREYTNDERAVLGPAISALGADTVDVYLNDHAFWRNVPATVWNYKLGGYQVLKKWLSYREHDVLGRALKPQEVHYFMEIARRIAAIVTMPH
ncbi:MAG: N-6 DNA methylase [Gemmatimonadetes bacterium]|nr:N-6 DNA methylase [Gemmatimonadota bacterium]MYG15935.1 N-6 DNA methylase [Gemmatimonadota bacterium]